MFGGIEYQVVYKATPSGGMTKELFPEYIRECVLPMCPGIGPDDMYGLHLDGDDSHLPLTRESLKDFAEFGELGLLMELPPPNLTHLLNEQV